MSRAEVTVVVPCYNEADRLSAESFAPLLSAGYRVLFVDDGSTDATSQVLDEICRARPDVSVMTLESNEGKGEAVRLGLLAACEAGAEFVGYLDADMATPAAEFVPIVDHLLDDPSLDVAIGSRVALLGRRVERRMTRHYAGRVFGTFASLALGMGVYDTQCGAKAFRVSPVLSTAIARPFETKWVFDLELIARLLHPDDGADGLGSERFVEVPLMEWRDVAGSHLKARIGLDAVRGLALARRQRLGREGHRDRKAYE